MGKALEKPIDTLYERDFHAWLNDQAAKLRARSHNDIDWDNLAEEVEDVGRNQKHQIAKRLGVLLMHLLKWEYQASRRGHSWQSTISEQRTHIAGLIKLSPSLARYPAETMEWSYEWARRHASYETKLAVSLFPEVSPYSVEQALDYRFMPGEPWTPESLLRD